MTATPTSKIVTVPDLVGPVTSCFWHQYKAWHGGVDLAPLPEGGIVINPGSTWAGKTYGWMQNIWLYAAYLPEMQDITVTSHSIPHLKAGVYKDAKAIWAQSKLLQQLFPRTHNGKKLWNESDRIWTHAKTGTTIQFDSFDLPKALGGKRDILFVNEANRIPFEVYQELATRTRKAIILDYNPATDFYAHELYRQDQAAGTGRVRRIRTTFQQNEFCPPHKVTEILRWKETDPMRWRVYGEGKTGRVEGLVFNWHISPIPEAAKLIGYGLDFGYFPDPTAFVAVYRLGQAVYVRELIYEQNLQPSQVIARVRNEMQRFGSAQVWADGSNPAMIKELSVTTFNTSLGGTRNINHAGLPIRAAKKGSGSILLGIEIMKEWELHIAPDSHNLNYELSGYLWPSNDLGNYIRGNPIGKADHLIDATRYCMAMTLSSTTSGAPTSTSADPNIFNPNL